MHLHAINILAQTTMPTGGFKTWGPEEWSLFFGAIVTFATAMAAIVKSFIADAKATMNRSSLQNVSQRVDNVNLETGKAQGMASSANSTANAAAIAVQGTGDGTLSQGAAPTTSSTGTLRPTHAIIPPPQK